MIDVYESLQTAKVVPDVWVEWNIIRLDDTVHWFRGGALLMSYQDPAPIRGRWFGFNNWESRSSFDELAIFALP